MVVCDLLTVGVRGRVVDLCQPAARKYETAVSVVLGRNIDAIVVDEEKTAIDCIEVLVPLFQLKNITHRYDDSTCGISGQAKQRSFLSTPFK
jgi:hypothetical protein